jgi:lysophospholipid acyltransferase (LPLAT)-like uncharacterized protein
MKISIGWSVRLGVWALRLLGPTWRVTRVNDAPWRALSAERRPFVFAFWHGTLLPLVWAHRNQGIVVLVSEHKDGEIIARVIEAMGFATTRGSSTRGGIRALLGLIRALEEGKVGGVTPDGPRGPRHSYAPGVLAGSRKAAAPIVSIGVSVSSAWHLRTWDQFVIPKPFARIRLAYSDPVLAGGLDDQSAEAQSFARLLHETTARAAGQEGS